MKGARVMQMDSLDAKRSKPPAYAGRPLTGFLAGRHRRHLQRRRWVLTRVNVTVVMGVVMDQLVVVNRGVVVNP